MKKDINILAWLAFLAAFSYGSDLLNLPAISSPGYKYALLGNFDKADARDEILVDFGTLGVWYYDEGHWTAQSGLNPDSMITVSTGTGDERAVVDFGTAGLWYWDQGAWTDLSIADAQGLFAVDDDFDSRQEIQVDFGAFGVWRYDFDDAGWTQLSALDPYCGLKTDLGAPGHEEGCWSFPGVGLWIISRSATGPAWDFEQLTGTENAGGGYVSGRFTGAAGPEDLVADFGSLGLWLCKGIDKSWTMISPMNAELLMEVKLADAATDEILAVDENGGMSFGAWDGAAVAWTPVAAGELASKPAAFEAFDRDGTDAGEEEVLIPLAAGGAGLFDFSEGPGLAPLVNGAFIVNSAVKGDYYGRGYDSTLAVAFSQASASPGFWLYEKDSNSALAGWTRLSISVPDSDN